MQTTHTAYGLDMEAELRSLNATVDRLMASAEFNLLSGTYAECAFSTIPPTPEQAQFKELIARIQLILIDTDKRNQSMISREFNGLDYV